jgi:hypothetical protein
MQRALTQDALALVVAKLKTAEDVAMFACVCHAAQEALLPGLVRRAQDAGESMKEPHSKEDLMWRLRRPAAQRQGQLPLVSSGSRVSAFVSMYYVFTTAKGGRTGAVLGQGLGRSSAPPSEDNSADYDEDAHGGLQRFDSPLPKPVKLPGSDFNVYAVSCGDEHCIAVANKISCSRAGVRVEKGVGLSWGCGGEGQLGQGVGIRLSSSAELLAANNDRGPLVAIAAEACCSMVVDQWGNLWTCGSGYSPLGHGNEPEHTHTLWELELVDGLPVIVAVAAAGGHALAVDERGRVFVWGSSTHGALGLGTGITESWAPTLVELPGHIATSVAAFDESSIVITSEGAVLQWGRRSWPEVRP